MAITAKSLIPNILKKAAIEKGMMGRMPDAENVLCLNKLNSEVLQKLKLVLYPNPKTKFRATSANLAASENDNTILKSIDDLF